METNNLTPDENLKNPIYFNKDEEPIKIYNTVEATGISFGGCADYPDSTPEEDMAETGCLVLFLFACLCVLAVLAVIFCLIYFN